MAILKLLDQRKTITDVSAIKAFMNSQGIIFEQWQAQAPLNNDDSQTRSSRPTPTSSGLICKSTAT